MVALTEIGSDDYFGALATELTFFEPKLDHQMDLRHIVDELFVWGGLS